MGGGGTVNKIQENSHNMFRSKTSKKRSFVSAVGGKKNLLSKTSKRVIERITKQGSILVMKSTASRQSDQQEDEESMQKTIDSALFVKHKKSHSNV